MNEIRCKSQMGQNGTFNIETFEFVTLSTHWTEPKLIVEYWAVEMYDRQTNTVVIDPKATAKRVELIPIKKPRGKKRWDCGEWR